MSMGPKPSSADTDGAAGAGGTAAAIGRAGRSFADALRLMVGVPNYGAYLRHMAATHPGAPVMDYEAFFRNRQQARYGGGKASCC